MTSYVTKEEYDRLAERLRAFEAEAVRVGLKINVGVPADYSAASDERVKELVREGVAAGLRAYDTRQRRGGLGTLQSQYAATKA